MDILIEKGEVFTVEHNCRPFGRGKLEVTKSPTIRPSQGALGFLKGELTEGLHTIHPIQKGQIKTPYSGGWSEVTQNHPAEGYVIISSNMATGGGIQFYKV